MPPVGVGRPSSRSARRPVSGGTLVELFHHHFQRTGGDVSATHAGYEEGCGMMQLAALKRIVEANV
jgi:hypothetical protein